MYLYLCVYGGLSLVLSVAGLQVGAILVLGVQFVAVLALDGECIVDEVFELFEGGDGLLQVGLFVLHLDYLGGQVLVGRHQLLVLVLVLIDFLPVVGREHS